MSKRQWLAVVVALLFIIGAIVFIITVQTRSQMSRLSAKLAAREGPHSPQVVAYQITSQGLIIKVHTTSPIVAVVRQMRPHVIAPVEFAIITRKDNVNLVLVPYPFAAEKEMYVALVTKTGECKTGSPYFGVQMDMGKDEYDKLWHSPQAKHFTKADSLMALRQMMPEVPEAVWNP
jgi:hypothetical protein